MSFVVSGLATLVTHGNLVVLFEHPEFGDLARTQVFGVKTLDLDRCSSRSS